MIRTYWRLAVSTAALVAVLLATAAAALATTPTPEPQTPPSIAQLCAATGIAEVDALLDGVARTDLVGALAPLASLVVPERDTAEIDASVQLDRVRKALNCAPTIPTATPEPTLTPGPTTTAPPARQVPKLPRGAAQTGGGPG